MPKKGTTTVTHLFVPGERDEYVDPHLASGWDAHLPCPAATPGD
ncbi:hypothetical protein [Streptomyces sp. NBC_01294]|nr:hypothetical protein [Streptomyces sp. NBC_01294]WRZ59214.1 hypothetical protein OG534_23665 [Streptomyces sp. NBC_01294]